jgi:DNA-binding NarL/FixJ family response regulator
MFRNTVLVVDDHQLLREGLIRLLAEQEDLCVCGQAEEPAGAVSLARQTHPDVAVVGLSIKEGYGLDLIRMLSVLDHPPLVVALSTCADPVSIEEAFRAGVKGYVTKWDPTPTIVDAIRRVLGGLNYASATTLSSLVRQAQPGGEDLAAPSPGRLSRRERQVFLMIGRGESRDEMAKSLHLSPRTIDSHRDNIIAKLGVRDSRALTKAAIAWVAGHPGRVQPVPCPERVLA